MTHSRIWTILLGKWQDLWNELDFQLLQRSREEATVAVAFAQEPKNEASRK